MTFSVIAETIPTDVATAASPNVVDLPEEISAGDLLLVIGSVDGAFMDVETPEGWQLLDVDGVDSLLCVFARIADGNEGATLSVTPSSAQEGKWLALRVTGWHGTTMPEIVSTSVDSSGGTDQPDPPSLALSGWETEDTLWLAIAGWDNGSQNRTLSSGPANYTAVNTQDFGVVCLSVYSRELAADTEDPGAFTLSGVEEWATMTLAIRPAAGGTPGSASGAGDTTEATAAAGSAQSVSVFLSGYRLVDKTSQPLTGLTGITALIYQSVPSSLTAPAKRVADLATDEETGVLDDIDLSDIQSNDDPVWLTLMLDGDTARGVTIKLVPELGTD